MYEPMQHMGGRPANCIIGHASEGVEWGKGHGEEQGHPDKGQCGAGFGKEGIGLRRAEEAGKSVVQDEGPACSREGVVCC